MPYAVEKRGSKWVTVTKTTGKVHGTFGSKGAAEGQLRALYANTDDFSTGGVACPKCGKAHVSSAVAHYLR